MTAVLLGLNPMASLDVVQQLPQQKQMLTPPSTLGTLPDRRIKEERGYNSIDEVTHARACSFCGTTSSATWEKADLAGRSSGYLCTPCANNWINRQHAVAQAKAKTEYKKIMRESPASSKKERREREPAQHHSEHSQDEYYDDYHEPNGPLKERGVGGGIGGGENNYYCRYCDTTWPLTYFRNRQQFGAHCSNCSRKRKPRDEPNPDPPSRQRIKKRVRKHSISAYHHEDSAAECSSYDEAEDTPHSPYGHGSRHDDSSPAFSPRDNISPSSFERGLMERLLNVVENKLVEVNELELIRKELQIMKSELLQREERRQSRLGEVKNMIVHGVSELRLKMAEQLSHKEGVCRKELEQMRDGMMVEFVLKERVIRNMLEGSTHTNHSMIQQQLQDMRTSFETKLDDMKSKMGNDLNGMEKLVANGIMKCEANIQDLLSELSSELNYQLEEVRMRFVTLEKVIKEDPRNRNSRRSNNDIDD